MGRHCGCAPVGPGHYWPGSDQCGGGRCPARHGCTYTHAAEYRYDGGRARYLVRQRDPYTFEPVGQGRWRDYDGEEIWGDYVVDGSTGVVTQGASIAAGLGFADPAGFAEDMPKYFHGDQIGSTRRITSSSAANPPTPAIKRWRAYTAFGEGVQNLGDRGLASAAERFAYAGAWGYEDAVQGLTDPVAELGWLHVGHRYYDPALGRFVQRDPIGIRGGTNAYSYCGNSPLQGVDPNGLEVIIIHWRGRGLDPGHTALLTSRCAYLSFVPIRFGASEPSFIGRTILDDIDRYGGPTDLWIIPGLDEVAIGHIACKYDGGIWTPTGNCIDSVLDALGAGGAVVPGKPGPIWIPPTGRRAFDEIAHNQGGHHVRMR